MKDDTGTSRGHEIKYLKVIEGHPLTTVAHTAIKFEQLSFDDKTMQPEKQGSSSPAGDVKALTDNLRSV